MPMRSTSVTVGIAIGLNIENSRDRIACSHSGMIGLQTSSAPSRMRCEPAEAVTWKP